MQKISAGIILYRRREGRLEVLLVHPGGPFWKKKDSSVWSIPKGEPDEGEDLLSAAKREFEEELGLAPPQASLAVGGPPQGEFLPLGTITQKGGKIVCAWTVEGDYDVKSIKSNTIKIEWPPRSGKFLEFPEVDRAEFFEVEEAKKKINPAQIGLLERLEAAITN
jgi:predicted NUDIX family NTP pyrophosphohydrolase